MSDIQDEILEDDIIENEIVEDDSELLDNHNEVPEEDGEGMFEHMRITVDGGQDTVRIDTFLTSRISSISRNRIQNAAKAGNILVNGEVVKQNYKVKPNDVISIVFSYPPREADIKPQEIPLNIVYEDNDVIIINKQAGLVVHPAHWISRSPYRQRHHWPDDCGQKRDITNYPCQTVFRAQHTSTLQCPCLGRLRRR